MQVIDDAVIQNVLRVLQDGRLFRYECTSAEDSPTANFELAFSKLIGRRHAVAMNSCSSALYVALLSAGVTPSDRVLVPAFTFTAVPSAVVHAGAQPVLVEMTADYAIDCDDLEKKITHDTRFLLLSYMRGRVPDIDRILTICDKHSITLIEDCAHSLGVLWDGVPTGRFGKVAAFSAQSFKIINAGEGGILVTDDDDIALKSILYSGAYETNWGKHFGNLEPVQCRELVNALPAFNFRMSNLTAAAITPQLSQIEKRVERFNGLFTRMCNILATSPYIRLPEFPDQVRPAADSVQFELVGLSSVAIDSFLQLLSEERVPLTVLGHDPFNARCFWNWRYFPQPHDCPRTRQLLEATADMRINLSWTDFEADRIAQAIVAASEKVGVHRHELMLV